MRIQGGRKFFRGVSKCCKIVLRETAVCTRGVQENTAIGLVVLQSAEIQGLIICFAIHFLCETIE